MVVGLGQIFKCIDDEPVLPAGYVLTRLVVVIVHTADQVLLLRSTRVDNPYGRPWLAPYRACVAKEDPADAALQVVQRITSLTSTPQYVFRNKPIGSLNELFFFSCSVDRGVELPPYMADEVTDAREWFHGRRLPLLSIPSLHGVVRQVLDC